MSKKYNSPGRIFVGNLERCVDEELLLDVFSAFGPVSDVEVVRKRGTTESRGFAFLSFRNTEDAELVIRKHQGMLLKGRPVKLDSATNTKSKKRYRSRSRDRYSRSKSRSHSPYNRRNKRIPSEGGYFYRKRNSRVNVNEVFSKLASFMRANKNMKSMPANNNMPNANALASLLLTMISGNGNLGSTNNLLPIKSSFNSRGNVGINANNNVSSMNVSPINMLQNMLATQNINPQNLTPAVLLSLLGSGNMSQTNLQNSANVLSGNTSMNTLLNTIIGKLCNASGGQSSTIGSSNRMMNLRKDSNTGIVPAVGGGGGTGAINSQLTGLSNFLMNNQNQAAMNNTNNNNNSVGFNNIPSFNNNPLAANNYNQNNVPGSFYSNLNAENSKQIFYPSGSFGNADNMGYIGNANRNKPSNAGNFFGSPPSMKMNNNNQMGSGIGNAPSGGFSNNNYFSSSSSRIEGSGGGGSGGSFMNDFLAFQDDGNPNNNNFGNNGFNNSLGVGDNFFGPEESFNNGQMIQQGGGLPGGNFTDFYNDYEKGYNSPVADYRRYRDRR